MDKNKKAIKKNNKKVKQKHKMKQLYNKVHIQKKKNS